MEAAWKLSMDDAGNPVHHEDLPSGKLLGLFQHRDRVFHVADAVQQRNLRCMLSSQQSDGAKIQRLLSVRQARPEFLQPRGEELRTLALQVRVRILRHKQKQQLWISWRCHEVYSFQIFEFWAAGAGQIVIPGTWASRCCSQLGEENSEH